MLKGTEVNYGITQKECLAIVWGIKQFHTYLYGIHFVFVTDHIALSWLNHTSPQNGRLARWTMYLQEYTFDIVYRKGHLHTNVDAVSRPVLAAAVISNTKQEEDADNDKTLEAYDDSHLLCYLQFKKLMPGASKRQIKRVTKLNNNYKLDLATNTLFYRKSEDADFVKVPHVSERHDIIEKAHLHFDNNSLQRSSNNNSIKQPIHHRSQQDLYIHQLTASPSVTKHLNDKMYPIIYPQQHQQ